MLGEFTLTRQRHAAGTRTADPSTATEATPNLNRRLSSLTRLLCPNLLKPDGTLPGTVLQDQLCLPRGSRADVGVRGEV